MKALYLCNSSYFSGAEQETIRALVIESSRSWVLTNLPGLDKKAEAMRQLRPGHQLNVKEIPRHNSGFVRELTFIVNAIKESRSEKVDLVVASNLKTAAAAAVARLFGGAEWIWYVHDYLGRRGVLRKIVAKILFATCSGWIAVSRDVAEVTKRIASPSKTGAVVYCCVRRSATPANPEASRTPMEEAILFVGSINSWKGLHCLVDCMRKVKQEWGSAPRIDVVGQVVEKEYWAGVQDLALQYGLELRYLGRRDDVPLLMRQYTVLIHPTPAPEPFGLAVVEAILAGCFVISSAQGGVRELLPPEMLECCFDPNVPSSLGRAMQAAKGAQVRYGRRQDSVISALGALTSEETYSRSLRNFFEKVAPEPAMQ